MDADVDRAINSALVEAGRARARGETVVLQERLQALAEAITDIYDRRVERLNDALSRLKARERKRAKERKAARLEARS